MSWVIYKINICLVILEAVASNVETPASSAFLWHHPMVEGRERKGKLSNYTPSGLFITGINQSIHGGGAQNLTPFDTAVFECYAFNTDV